MDIQRNRSQHFFAYQRDAASKDQPDIKDTVIGCHKVKVSIGEKKKSVVVFTRISLSEFINRDKSAIKSAALALVHLEKLYQNIGMKKNLTLITVENIKHTKDNELQTFNAISTAGFEKFVVGPLSMPVISSVSDTAHIQSAETLFKSGLKKAFEGDPGNDNPQLKNDHSDVGELSQSEIAPEVSNTFVSIKKKVQLPASLLNSDRTQRMKSTDKT